MRLLRQLRALFHKETLDREMSEEMRHHLELQIEENVAAGMNSDEARYAAYRSFGGVEQIKEQARDQRGIVWVDQLMQDLRYAFRQLRKSPGFTLVTVLSLAIGLGANTALYSLVDDVLLRSLPVAKPDELVLFRWAGGAGGSYNGIQGYPATDRASGLQSSPFFSYFAFERLRDSASTVSDLFAFARLPAMTTIDGQTELAYGQAVTGNYFGALGIRAHRGRLLGPDDERPAASPAAVISYDFWQQRFSGSDQAVGKTIRVNDVTFTVVGVMPRGFHGTGEFGEGSAVILPLSVTAQLKGDPGFLKRPLIWWVNIMGRLRPGMTLMRAQVELNPVFVHATKDARLAGEPGSPGRDLTGHALPRLQLDSGAQGLPGVRQAIALPLELLLCIVGGVLLIACLNVANLLLARSLTRRKEIAVRLSLGAGRGRILRQLLTESAVLTLLGGLLGLLVAHWVRDIILYLWPIGSGPIDLNGQVLAFALGVTFLSGLLFGLAPAWRATRLSLEDALKTGSAGATVATRAHFRGGLMIVQVAVAVVLLVGTGLFLRTLRNFATLDVGFERSRLLYFGLNAGASRPNTPEQAELSRRFEASIHELSGVESSALVARPLLSGSRGNVRIILNNPRLPSDQRMGASTNEVTPALFRTLGIPLLQGRTFTAAEADGGAAVVVVNATFARTFFPGENPLGRTFATPGSSVFHTPDRQWEIIGVAADARYADLRSQIPATVYSPITDPSNGTFVVRTTADPRSIVTSLQSALHTMAPDASLRNVRTQQEAIDRQLSGERLFALLSALFGFIALGLTCLGLYGLLAHDVAARTREIGIRLALGAPVQAVVTLILGGGMKLVLAGLVLGLAAAFALMRFVSAFLFNVLPTDPVTFGGVAALLMLVALLACWLPARRATKVDPIIALRSE